MDAAAFDQLVPILIPLGFFAMVFGIVYIRSREKMGMIERGMDPNNSKVKGNSNYVLTTGLLLIGSGIGLFLAYILSSTIFFHNNENPALYFALIATFGGIGLFLAYRIEKKDSTNKQE